MAFEDLMKQLRERTARVLAMGGADKLAKRKAEGHLNARERIDYLVDPDSFFESGHVCRRDAPRSARTRRRPTARSRASRASPAAKSALVSNDFTVLGASSSVINMKKIKHVKQVAAKRGLPLVLLGESSGARMPDRMGSAGRAIIAQDPTEYQRLRETPWASALLGACYGSSTWYSAMSDFVVMRKGAIMAIASPGVTSIAINKPIDRRGTRRLEAADRRLRAGRPGSRHRRAGARRDQAVSVVSAEPLQRAAAGSSGARRLGLTHAARCSISCPSRATRFTTCAK